jgi:signal peptidase I
LAIDMSAQTPLLNSQSLSSGTALLNPPQQPKSHKSSVLRQLWQVLFVASLAMASYLLVSHYVVGSVKVVGVSMLPTLHDSERYLLNRWVFYLRSPHPNDVVVLRDPMDNGFSVKRIVARAGDSVYLKDGGLFINGRKLDEPYLKPGTPTFASGRHGEQLFQCGPDQFFVLGDNRNNSIDSRVYGPVPRRNILGLIVR